jgi:hypothetical protein
MNLGTYLIEDMLGPRPNVDVLERKMIILFLLGCEPQTVQPYLVAIPTTSSQFPFSDSKKYGVPL